MQPWIFKEFNVVARQGSLYLRSGLHYPAQHMSAVVKEHNMKSFWVQLKTVRNDEMQKHSARNPHLQHYDRQWWLIDQSNGIVVGESNETM